MDPSSPATKAIAAMRRGILWIASGTGAMLFVSLKASDGQTYFFMWGLISPRLFIGAFIVLGLFEMTCAYVRGRGVSDPHGRTRLKIGAALCLAVLAVAAISSAAAWRHGAPFWSAVAALSQGDEAAQRLKTIAERHAAKMESGVRGPEAL